MEEAEGRRWEEGRGLVLSPVTSGWMKSRVSQKSQCHAKEKGA